MVWVGDLVALGPSGSQDPTMLQGLMGGGKSLLHFGLGQCVLMINKQPGFWVSEVLALHAECSNLGVPQIFY